jgi:hypothetical protein
MVFSSATSSTRLAIQMARITSILRVNTLAAVLGGSAVVTMGVIAATMSGTPEGSATVVSGGSMTLGETTTVTYTGTIAPAVAAPAVKAPPYGGSGG